MRGLIGGTGFVGGNLAAQTEFDVTYHSRDIEEIRGRTFDLVVSAGAPAEKWRANQEPEIDAASIARLTESLEEVTAEKFVLISTVDVYRDPNGVDESTSIDATECAPYGRHRKELEEFVQDRFDTLVVRLPGLFGDGLKKNVIYDLMHGHRLSQVDPRATFQFYSLDWIWRDISLALEAGLSVVNFATEPIVVGEIVSEVFGTELPASDGPRDGEPVRYDFRSRRAEVFGGRGGYLYDRKQVMTAMKAFVERTMVVAG